MRVIGIDPGTRHLGWGVLERVGTRIAHVAHGVIDCDEKLPLHERLVIIDVELGQVIATHAPEFGAVEGIFFAKNAQSAAKLGHARGVVLLRLAQARLGIAEYAPALVKKTVAGRGASDKNQVAMLVTAILRLASPPRSDAADALAIALTHLSVSSFASQVKAQAQLQARSARTSHRRAKLL